MNRQWEELKETIIELRDNNGTCTQQEACKFLANYMEILEKQIQEPIRDAVSRKAVLNTLDRMDKVLDEDRTVEMYKDLLKECYTVLPSVKQEPRTRHCKDCKYFEYDSVAKVDGVPLIVAHEICSRWGDGCKTKEDGYCFLFDPQKSEDK